MSDKTELLEYWLISIPNQGSSEQAVSALKRIVQQRGGEHQYLDKLPTQRLKVGTLDKLIALSDDLGRIDSFGKNVVQKLHRSYAELEETDQLLSVYNKSIRGYISNFLWDEGHFNPRAQLRDLVQVIHSNMVKTAEHLRKWTSTLSEIQNTLNAIERKKTGSLMNKSLAQVISHEDWYAGDYVTSALVVVPKAKCIDFSGKYEFFEDSNANKLYYEMIDRKQHENEEKNDADVEEQPLVESSGKENKLKNMNCRVVVPESLKEITSDSEFTLFRVLLLKRGYDWFKFVCMKQGFAVRDFNISEIESEADESKLNELRKKEISQKKKVQLFCKNTFSETFANWIHLKVIRCFVESVLRFGLPIDFSVSVIKPVKGRERALLKHLESKYNHLLADILKNSNEKDNENEIDYSGQMNDFYPFVYTECKVEL